ncbi:unnamed protein product [Heligmosomoides polygyrus]|uniref:G_PROTEIN_RECEP_F1_2 domain-containing protein n=1 Tax=Heligmosomoides polygyrus TaxID=6339 RepID=A0A183GKY0_HELPZ|nr:unnamed protein product [Heligmosomoides polygyrus]
MLCVNSTYLTANVIIRQYSYSEMLLILAPADILQVAISLVAFRWPVAGWSAVLDKPYLAKIGFVVSNFACNIELFVQLILSINRLTAICFPLRHNRLWTTKRTIMCFVGCAAISLAPAITRLYQDAGYFAVDGKAVPYLLHEEDQKVPCHGSSSSAESSGLLVVVHSSHHFHGSVSGNHYELLKIQKPSWSFAFTNESFQCLLALDVFPLRTDEHTLLIIMLTLSADCFALSNPWLLLALSETFRTKFVKVGTFACHNIASRDIS